MIFLNLNYFSTNLSFNNYKIKFTNIKLLYLTTIFSFFLLFFIFVFALSFNNGHLDAYGHTFVINNDNNASVIQTKTNGSYKVELSTNPSKIPINKSIDILLRVTSISNPSSKTAGAIGGGGGTGAEVQEIPAYLSLVKDGNVKNLQNNLVMIRGGHFDLNSVFPDKGKYLLFVDIKDIYYTNNILHFAFDINVGIHPIDQFYSALESFLLNYYYIYIPIIGIIFIFIYWPRQKTQKEVE
jgi:hypothetical protein